jgi:hypothetical protein
VLRFGNVTRLSSNKLKNVCNVRGKSKQTKKATLSSKEDNATWL